MRLWTLHPAELDARGLVAAWREALLAQAVLRGRTRGYRQHPQLERFRAAHAPVGAIATYLAWLADEADARGYRFDRTRIARARTDARIDATRGQLEFERAHLTRKLRVRDPAWLGGLGAGPPRAHPLFRIVPGEPEAWERAAPTRRRHA